MSTTIFRGKIKTQEERDNPAHPWRANSLIKANGIPSIALYKGKDCLVKADNEADF